MIKILIVEDNEMDRVLVTHLLSDHYEFVYATDGDEGLTKCDSESPDIVVSDIVMPTMNGLEMLSVLQARHPQIPVIMMTAKGDEATATEAMELGAASYVPKTDLPDLLRETVDQVVDMMRVDRDYARLLEHMSSCRYRFELENDLSLIEPLVEFVQQITFAQGICHEGDRHRIGVALEQAFFNAIYHGNLELPAAKVQEIRQLYRDGQVIELVNQRLQDPSFASRTVVVDIKATDDELRISIRDEGDGSHYAPFLDARQPELDPDRHRDLVLMKTIMDEISFNQNGSQITMVKSRERSTVGAEAVAMA